VDENEQLKHRMRELELELEDAKNLSRARERLLTANIKELNESYNALRGKVNDIRERDKKIRDFTEVLTRANRLSALGELAASIAHEIKNPLISIQGFARRIGQGQDAAKTDVYAKFIEKEAERLSTVLIKLLDFSRMAEPNREHLDVNRLVDDTILFLEHHLTRFRNIALNIEKDETLPAISGDKVHIQQAFVNLVMNGAQAMPEGGPLTVKTGRRDDVYAFVAVADKGTGIRDEDIGKIFNAFFTTKREGEGTGLGLSLVKRLIEANGGRIEVESRVNVGSTFTLLLPFAQTASGERAQNVSFMPS
jgi:signal transduction histidine kinase